MNWRWYITGLLIVLAFYGAGTNQSTTNPNQEIVVKFNANSITANEAKVAVAEITNQLKTIGVEDITISNIVDGKVKVTYYSSVDVAIIKNLLYQHNKLDIGSTAFNETENSSKFPFSNDSNTYKFEVIKIKQDIDTDAGFHGTLVEIKSFSDQYLKPKLSPSASEVACDLDLEIEYVQYTTYFNIDLLTENSRHKTPRVRAGPLS